eukprot:SM000373S13619  [mRNA]  locus=s373:55604:56027:- [translate_table: standard]
MPSGFPLTPTSSFTNFGTGLCCMNMADFVDYGTGANPKEGDALESASADAFSLYSMLLQQRGSMCLSHGDLFFRAI